MQDAVSPGERLAEIDARDDLRPCRLMAICHFANAVGALTPTRVGAIPALPTRDEALAFWSERAG